MGWADHYSQVEGSSGLPRLRLERECWTWKVSEQRHFPPSCEWCCWVSMQPDSEVMPGSFSKLSSTKRWDSKRVIVFKMSWWTKGSSQSTHLSYWWSASCIPPWSVPTEMQAPGTEHIRLTWMGLPGMKSADCAFAMCHHMVIIKKKKTQDKMPTKNQQALICTGGWRTGGWCKRSHKNCSKASRTWRNIWWQILSVFPSWYKRILHPANGSFVNN